MTEVNNSDGGSVGDAYRGKLEEAVELLRLIVDSRHDGVRNAVALHRARLFLRAYNEKNEERAK